MTSSVQFAIVCLSFVWHFCGRYQYYCRGGGGYFRVQVTGDNQKSFLSLKFSIPGFFWVGKFGLKVFFWGGLIQVKICFDIQNKLKIRGRACVFWLLTVLLIFCVISFNALWNFEGLEIRHGIFFRVGFWTRDFFRSWVLPLFNHPCHLKSGVPLQTAGLYC